ncbi:MAG: ChbG/HpnK family deacetylase [Pseudomonadota bacterium]|nr:ChbG/HpnK family deacetylase [Pseudomonadota bacterium]
MSRPWRTLALCADDFGLTPGISAGIAGLARAGRLCAVGCITNSPHWSAAASLLENLPPSVDVGMHLNLTEGSPLSPRLARRWPTLPGLPRLLLQAHARLLPMAAVRSEVHAQLAAFNQELGRPPAFIDGHQHVHHLPGVRDAVLDMVEHLQPLPAVRNTGQLLGPGFDFKRWVIEVTGGRRLARDLRLRVIAHNPALLGAYDFADPNYQSLMRGWLAALPPEGGLLFCHPGKHLEADPPDAIAEARERELAYLGSVAFDADLAAAGVRLGRVWRGGAPPYRNVQDRLTA